MRNRESNASDKVIYSAIKSVSKNEKTQNSAIKPFSTLVPIKEKGIEFDDISQFSKN